MPLFDNQTPEGIRARILERMETQLQTREGSFLYDVVSPAAFELWRNLMAMNELIAAFYVTQDSGEYLDKHADLLGLSRREGVKARAVLNFTGTDGTIIPAETAFYTTSGLKFFLSSDVVISEGTAAGEVIGEQVGDLYNVGAGEITQIAKNISGLSFVSEPAQGGVDEESDQSLYDRIDFRRKNPSTSGNASHYLQWARSRSNVGAAKVIPVWNGPGTVKVILTDYDFLPAKDDVVADCAAYIESQRPIGAQVTVVSAAQVYITVSAAMVLDGVTTVDQVIAEFRSGIQTYISKIVASYFSSLEAVDYYVYYSKIAAILAGIQGVVDYNGLTINGAAANVMIDSSSVPVLKEVTLT